MSAFSGLVIAAVAGSLVVGALALMAAGDPNRPLTPEEVPTLSLDVARWVDRSGRFVVPVYDDRAISEEERAANPVVDPRWEPFAQCMASGGFPVAISGRTFLQEDMDGLVDRVNASRPDAAANRDSARSGVLPPGLALQFIECANAWLTLSPEEVDALGLGD